MVDTKPAHFYKLLIVEDNPLNLDLLVSLLGESYDLRVSTDGPTALELIATGFMPDLLLLDILMPGMDGYEVCRQIKEDPATWHIPIIFLSALDGDVDQVKGLDLGAVDYITKPFNPALVHQRVKNHLQLRDKQNRLERLVGQQTSDLQQTISDLRRSEERLKQAQKVSQVGSWELDLRNQQFVWSDVTYRIFDRDPQHFQPTLDKLLESVHPQDRDEVSSAYRKSRAQNIPYEIVYRLQGADGRIKHVLEKCEYRFDDQGRVNYLIGTIQDVTVRHQAEQKIRSAKEEWEATFDAMNDLVTIHDDQKHIVRANRRALEFLGCGLEDLAEKKCHQALWGADYSCSGCPFSVGLENQGTQTQTQTVSLPDQERLFHVTTTPLPNAHGEPQHCIQIARDITQERHIQKESDRSNRLAALGELAAGIAHEINNPNALILYNSELLNMIMTDFLPLIEDRQDRLGTRSYAGLSLSEALEEIPMLLPGITDASQRIRRIVNDLRDFARRDSDDMKETVDLNEALEAAVRLVANPLKKVTDHFSLDLSPDRPQVAGIKGRLEQVFINLLLNACQALEDRSRAIQLVSRYLPEQGRVEAQVIDQGCGMEEGLQEKILEPFMTTRRDQGGTGLGLSVSGRIIKEHGGSIHFSSAVGQGTTVTVSLPAAREL